MIVLLRAGADPSQPNLEGKIPYDLAANAAVGDALLFDRDDILKRVMSPMQITRHELALSSTPMRGGGEIVVETVADPAEESTSPKRKVPHVPKLDLSSLSLQEESEKSPRNLISRGKEVSAAAAAGAARRREGGNEKVYSDYRDAGGYKDLSGRQKDGHTHIYSNSPRFNYSQWGYGGFESESKGENVPIPPPPQLLPSTTAPPSLTSSISQGQDAADFDRKELEAAVLLAATETSAAYLEQDVTYEDRLFLFKACQPPPKDPAQLKKNVERLNLLLKRRPALLHTRCIDMGNLGKDGQTMLHVAANSNNLTILKLLLTASGATAWIRDLQGRTPLHCAVEAVKSDNVDVCRELRRKMCEERPGNDPVGETAPVDLAGRTPLGRQNRAKVTAIPSQSLLEVLYRDGDRSVMPHSPVNTRSGHSPWKTSPVPVIKSAQGDNIRYAFSEASGWRHYMEDRVLASFPFVNQRVTHIGGGLFENDVGLFGICDGHGGSFVSQYMVDAMPRVAKTAMDSCIENQKEGAPVDILSSSLLREILYQCCHTLEEELRALPRLEVDLKAVKGETINESTGQPIQPKPTDSSGSTGLFCIVTSHFYAIANVGDSRVVVAQFPSSHKEENSTPLATTKGMVISPFDHGIGLKISDTDKISASEFGSELSSSEGGLVVFWSSKDHKCHDAQEKSRIERAGLAVVEINSGSQGSKMKIGNETISMSRSFADFSFKQNQRFPADQQALIAVPDVNVFSRSENDAFIVLASDGVFDVMSNQDVVDFLARKLGFLPPLLGGDDCETNAFSSPLPNRTQYSSAQRPVGGFSSHTAANACDALLKECLKRGSSDNMSVLVLLLGSPPIPASTNGKIELTQKVSEINKQLNF